MDDRMNAAECPLAVGANAVWEPLQEPGPHARRLLGRQMTIEHAALATVGFVIFLILILMSNKQRRLRQMQSKVNDLRIIESRRFLMALNAGKAHLAQPGNDTAVSPGAEVESPALAAVVGAEVIPLVASRR
jgi:hypothetical protein